MILPPAQTQAAPVVSVSPVLRAAVAEELYEDEVTAAEAALKAMTLGSPP